MFHEALNFTLMNEGGYSDDPQDKGGRTKWGISQNAYPNVNISEMKREEMETIYFNDYWNPLYSKLNNRLAVRLFDLGVNVGVRRAVKVLQKTLNKHFDVLLKEDGAYGLITHRLITKNNQQSVYSALVFEASLYYSSLNQPRFFKGWLNRLYKNI